jgi:hypothetical protein
VVQVIVKKIKKGERFERYIEKIFTCRQTKSLVSVIVHSAEEKMSKSTNSLFDYATSRTLYCIPASSSPIHLLVVVWLVVAENIEI